MEKFLVKNFYKISFFLFIVCSAVISLFTLKSLNRFLIIIIFMIIFLFLYYIHYLAHKRIEHNFWAKKFYLERINDKQLTEDELDKLYSEVYDSYFKNS